MQLNIPNNLKTPIRNIMRQCGYFENYDKRTEKTSYIRNLGRNFYPRFHVYIKENNNSLLIDLHIDQKKMSYEGFNAHSGEYDSDAVLREGDRIKQILNKSMENNQKILSDSDGGKKGFFSKIFG